MKAILEFNLPEDKDVFAIANNGIKYHCALWDFSQFLRSELKHNDNLTREELAIVERLNEEFIGILENYNINLSEIE